MAATAKAAIRHITCGRESRTTRAGNTTVADSVEPKQRLCKDGRAIVSRMVEDDYKRQGKTSRRGRGGREGEMVDDGPVQIDMASGLLDAILSPSPVARMVVPESVVLSLPSSLAEARGARHAHVQSSCIL